MLHKLSFLGVGHHVTYLHHLGATKNTVHVFIGLAELVGIVSKGKAITGAQINSAVDCNDTGVEHGGDSNANKNDIARVGAVYVLHSKALARITVDIAITTTDKRIFTTARSGTGRSSNGQSEDGRQRVLHF